MKNTYINCTEGDLCARRELRRVCIALFAASLTVFLLLPCLPVHGEAEIYRKVLRLHGIAADTRGLELSVKYLR